MAENTPMEFPPTDTGATVEMIDSDRPKGDVDMNDTIRTLPPLEGLEIEAGGQHRVVVTNFSQIKETKRYTEEFDIGGHRWRILIFPRGNRCEYLSLYLDYCDPRKNAPSWSCCAHFAMTLSNPTDPSVNITKEAQHRFHPEESDWGFTQFMKLGLLHNETHVAGRDFIANDSLVLTVTLNIIKDTTGQLWRDYLNYDSKRETGHVGLKNQGATCYMNSILQSLFFTKYLRKAVFKMPTLNDEVGKSVPLALQRVFYQLQKSDTAISTTELTKSFGWDTLDSFMQHDVQEFNRVLCDNLETKMKSTPVEGIISQLFEGKMRSYIKCIQVPYESARTESFYDIQLNVKGLKTVEDAFKDYVAVETLEGDNRYFAEGYGLQDAKKGVIFESFPPVLHLQLKRFEYDLQRDMMVKINDRFEFPLVITLDAFMDSAAAEKNNALPTQEEKDTNMPLPTPKQRYHLHAVLVHAGDVNSGHYCAFIRPDKEGSWYKFDDDRVTVASEREAVMDNYGDSFDTPSLLSHTTNHSTTATNNGNNATNIVHSPVSAGGFMTGQRPLKSLHKRFTNAYMLVYIRESDLDQILCPVTDDDMPAHLRERFDRERVLDEQRRREKEEQHLYVRVNVATEQAMMAHSGIDLVNFDDKNHPKSDILSLRLRKDITVRELKHLLLPHIVSQQRKNPIQPSTLFPLFPPFSAKALEATEETLSSVDAASKDADSDFLGLYVLVGRQNKTLRPSQPELSDADPLSLITEERSKYPAELRLFCEYKVRDKVLSAQNYVLVIIKVYDPVADHLHTVSTVRASPQSTPVDLLQWLRTHLSPALSFTLFSSENRTESPLLGDPSSHLRCYEEVRPTMVSPLKWSTSLASQEIGDGDIVVFQPLPLSPTATVVHYFDRLVNRIVVRFREKKTVSSGVDSNPPEDRPSDTHESTAVLSQQQPPPLSLCLNKKMTYEEVASALATSLTVDPHKLRLYSVNSYTDSPKSPVKRTMTLQDMLQPSYYAPPTDLLYYELLSIRLTELENKRPLKLMHVNEHGEEVTYELLLDKHATVQDALRALSERIRLSQTGQLRLLEVFNSKIMRQYDALTPIEALTEYGTLMAQEISTEEIHRRVDRDALVAVSHYYRDPFRCFGVPFLFVLRAGEALKETRARLCAALRVSDKEFDKYKVTVVVHGKARVVEEDSGECLLDALYPQGVPQETTANKSTTNMFTVDPDAPYIGLDHPDKSGRLNKNGSFERSIVIKN